MMKRDTSLHDLELWEYVLHHFKMLPPLTDTMREAFNPTSWQQDLHHSLARYFRHPSLFMDISQAIFQMRRLRCKLTNDVILDVTPFGWRYDRMTCHLFLMTATKRTLRSIRTSEIQSVHILDSMGHFDIMERYFDTNHSIDSSHYRKALVRLHPRDGADEERLLMKLSLYPKKVTRHSSQLTVTLYYESAYEPTFRRFLRTLGDRITVLSPHRLVVQMEKSINAMLSLYDKKEGMIDT